MKDAIEKRQFDGFSIESLRAAAACAMVAR
jgi:hypothetical protein